MRTKAREGKGGDRTAKKYSRWRSGSRSVGSEKIRGKGRERFLGGSSATYDPPVRGGMKVRVQGGGSSTDPSRGGRLDRRDNRERTQVEGGRKRFMGGGFDGALDRGKAGEIPGLPEGPRSLAEDPYAELMAPAPSPSSNEGEAAPMALRGGEVHPAKARGMRLKQN